MRRRGGGEGFERIQTSSPIHSQTIAHQLATHNQQSAFARRPYLGTFCQLSAKIGEWSHVGDRGWLRPEKWPDRGVRRWPPSPDRLCSSCSTCSNGLLSRSGRAVPSAFCRARCGDRAPAACRASDVALASRGDAHQAGLGAGVLIGVAASRCSWYRWAELPSILSMRALREELPLLSCSLNHRSTTASLGCETSAGSLRILVLSRRSYPCPAAFGPPPHSLRRPSVRHLPRPSHRRPSTRPHILEGEAGECHGVGGRAGRVAARRRSGRPGRRLGGEPGVSRVCGSGARGRLGGARGGGRSGV